jgi:hypothetical protein
MIAGFFTVDARAWTCKNLAAAREPAITEPAPFREAVLIIRVSLTISSSSLLSPNLKL